MSRATSSLLPGYKGWRNALLCSQLSGFSLFRTNRKAHNRVKRAPCEPHPAGGARAAAGLKMSRELIKQPQKAASPAHTPPIPTSLTAFRATWKLAKADKVHACSTWHVVLQYCRAKAQSSYSYGPPCCHVPWGFATPWSSFSVPHPHAQLYFQLPGASPSFPEHSPLLPHRTGLI